MIWIAKYKLLPMSLEPRHIPWALCAILALGTAVAATRHGDDATKISQLEKRLRTLEKNVTLTEELDNYSTIPRPAEQLPPLDSPQFYAKCEQWNVNPDKVKSLARRLARQQGIQIEEVQRTRVAVKTERATQPRLVAFAEVKDPIDHLLEATDRPSDIEALALSPAWQPSSASEHPSARPKSSRRHRSHRRASSS